MKFLWSVLFIIVVFGVCFTAAFSQQGTQTPTVNGIPAQSVYFLTGTSASIGGSLMVAGTPVTGTITVAGSVVGMGCLASPTSSSALITGTWVDCYVSSANTVTLRLISVLATTPAAQTYNVRVIP